jgi:hypothetical protein
MALAVAALLSMTGCGSGSSSGPGTLPPLSAPPSTSPSLASPAPSTSAAGGKKAELAAATAVVRRYYRLLNAPTSEASANALQALILPNCKCQEIVRSLRSATRKHEHYVGSGHLTALRAAYDSPQQVQILVSFASTKGGLARGDGSFVQHTKAQRNVTENVFVFRTHADWMISEIDLVSAGN